MKRKIAGSFFLAYSENKWNMNGALLPSYERDIGDVTYNYLGFLMITIYRSVTVFYDVLFQARRSAVWGATSPAPTP